MIKLFAKHDIIKSGNRFYPDEEYLHALFDFQLWSDNHGTIVTSLWFEHKNEEIVLEFYRRNDG